MAIFLSFIFCLLDLINRDDDTLSKTRQANRQNQCIKFSNQKENRNATQNPLTCSSLSIESNMGNKHASKFGNHQLPTSASLFDYALLDSNSFFKQNSGRSNFSLLKYSLSFPANFDLEANQTSTPSQTDNSINDSSNTLSSVKSKVCCLKF